MGHVLPPHDSGDGFQCRTDKTIAWRVDGQLIKSTCHQATIEQLMPFSVQDIDPPPHAIEDGIPRAVAETETAALPDFNCVDQDLGDQIGQIVWVVLQTDIADAASAEQVRCIQHQQPQIAHRNSSDVAICAYRCVLDLLHE